MSRHRRRVPWWRRPFALVGLLVPRRRRRPGARRRSGRAGLVVVAVAAVVVLLWAAAGSSRADRPAAALPATTASTEPPETVEDAMAAAPLLPAVTSTTAAGRPVIVVSISGAAAPIAGQLLTPAVRPGQPGQAIVALPDFDPVPYAPRGAVVWTDGVAGAAQRIVWTVQNSRAAVPATWAAIVDKPVGAQLTLISGSGPTRGVVTAVALDQRTTQ